MFKPPDIQVLRAYIPRSDNKVKQNSCISYQLMSSAAGSADQAIIVSATHL